MVILTRIVRNIKILVDLYRILYGIDKEESMTRVSKHQRSIWFDRGVKREADFMLVCSDNINSTNYYPIYYSKEECIKKRRRVALKNSSELEQCIISVYDLSQDKLKQIEKDDVWNWPAE